MTSTPAAPRSADHAGDTATDRAGGPGADPGAVIAQARERIDDLDARIIALVQERMTVSAGIQRTRIESGGRRVHLSREMEVLRRYGDPLGRPGTALAMTLLELCRGRS
ncbi:chorismate mutase [Actinacidiphila sp. bgisy167]|uniref:chorismate mutase n=1 Tax=Actinacidiphila sp. bgisy167 TaxID=3413797 RepID=UPI003D716615